jgi:hypothetical protein
MTPAGLAAIKNGTEFYEVVKPDGTIFRGQFFDSWPKAAALEIAAVVHGSIRPIL